MIKKYTCWRCKRDYNGEIVNRWLKKSELKRVVQDKGHTDYVCPFCEAVIICVSGE